MHKGACITRRSNLVVWADCGFPGKRGAAAPADSARGWFGTPSRHLISFGAVGPNSGSKITGDFELGGTGSLGRSEARPGSTLSLRPSGAVRRPTAKLLDFGLVELRDSGKPVGDPA